MKSMETTRARTAVLLAVFSLSACGFLRGETGDDEHEAVTAPAVVTPPPTMQARMDATNGVVYRWSDGDWIARVTFTVHNPTSAPIAISHAQIVAAEMSPWPQAGTLPDATAVQPGQQITGDVAWYRSGAQPMPRSVNISFGAWSTVAPLTPVPLPPRPGHPLAGPVEGSVVITAPEGGTTWRHPSDQDHIVKVAVSIRNETNLPLQLPSGFVSAAIGDQRGSWWSAQASLPDPLPIEPGATATGFASWFFPGAMAVPESVVISLGAPAYPTATTQVALTVTSPPP